MSRKGGESSSHVKMVSKEVIVGLRPEIGK